MAKMFKVLNRYGSKLSALVVLSSCIFFFSGGFDWLNGTLFGCVTYEQFRNTLLAPLFGGFLMMGVFGLYYAYKHSDSRMCLVGFGITIFCYGAIEWLYSFL